VTCLRCRGGPVPALARLLQSRPALFFDRPAYILFFTRFLAFLAAPSPGWCLGLSPHTLLRYAASPLGWASCPAPKRDRRTNSSRRFEHLWNDSRWDSMRRTPATILKPEPPRGDRKSVFLHRGFCQPVRPLPEFARSSEFPWPLLRVGGANHDGHEPPPGSAASFLPPFTSSGPHSASCPPGLWYRLFATAVPPRLC